MGLEFRYRCDNSHYHQPHESNPQSSNTNLCVTCDKALLVYGEWATGELNQQSGGPASCGYP
jgi:hypothetical protein